tara:strand:+ start:120 stop:572 length:453 start_codon:yes stop_codon:yes gene_type:complete
LALNTLKNHPAVLQTPEPLVLVNGIMSGKVELCIYFWMDGNKYNWQKVKSSAIRLIKRAFQDAKILIPGTEIEISFADEAVVSKQITKDKKVNKVTPMIEESINSTTNAEGWLSSDKDEIQKQAQKSDVIGKEENLLIGSKNSSLHDKIS